MNLRKGFTYTEVLITLAVMAALFVPMMQLFSQALVSSAVTGQTIMALNLGKWQMERIKNLNYTISQLKAMGDNYFPPLNEPPLQLNEQRWRILTDIDPDSEPLKIKVSVFLNERLGDKPLVELVTLLTDTTWLREKKEVQ